MNFSQISQPFLRFCSRSAFKLYKLNSDGFWALGLIAFAATLSNLSVEDVNSAPFSFPFPKGSIITEEEVYVPPEIASASDFGLEEEFIDNESASVTLIENVTSEGTTSTLEQEKTPEVAIAQSAQKLVWDVYTIQRNDTLGRILNKIAPNDVEAQQFITNQKLGVYRRLRRNHQIEYRLAANGLLKAVRYKASPDLIFEFERNDGVNMSAIERSPTLTPELAISSGKITREHNSLFAATDIAGVPDPIIQRVINALETRVDFARDTRLNDEFVLVYEKLLDEDGQYATAGKLLGFMWINRGKEIIGLYYPEQGGYFDPEGHSIQRAFLRSPLKFTRISSKFTLRRYHPILKKWRAHRGVDFAAKTGTPVRTTADGKVIFRGRKGGYGNTVIIEHFGKYRTLYAHLSKFNSKAKNGSRVEQGQVVAYVGTTGLSSGPHLHYEFLVDGVHKDPLSEVVPVRRPALDGQTLRRFQISTANTMQQIRQTISGDLQAGKP